MKNLIFLVLILFVNSLKGQTAINSVEDNSTEAAHSVLPIDGVITYLPKDTTYFNSEMGISAGKIHIQPLINFFFRPETTSNYKEAGIPVDTGHLNFYLRGDFGARIGLPKNIDMVFNLHSFGVYTRSFGPLDQNMTLYEAYVDMKKLDRNGRMSVRFGRIIHSICQKDSISMRTWSTLLISTIVDIGHQSSCPISGYLDIPII